MLVDHIQAIKKDLDVQNFPTLKEAVYQSIRKSIILGAVPAGTRINELQLAEELNLSRTPIRFALNELADEKLVQRIPGIGTEVVGIDQADAREIFEIRKALDALATVMAMNHMSEEEFQELKDLLERGDVYHKNDQVVDLTESFSEFNEFIYEKAAMPRLKSIVHELRTYLGYFRTMSIFAEERRTFALQEHWMIYRGMVNRDEMQVRLIIDEHLEHSLTFILEEMNRLGID